jgi:predicted dithiol-disulfide oxidoreductase (DUF899 family)
VQHFMLKPGAEAGCKGCSYMADHVDGMTVHLAHREYKPAAPAKTVTAAGSCCKARV